MDILKYVFIEIPFQIFIILISYIGYIFIYFGETIDNFCIKLGNKFERYLK